MVEDLHVAGAVHRLERVDPGLILVLGRGVVILAVAAFIDFNDEHVVLVLVPVTRGFPEFAVHNLWRVDFLIAARPLFAAHVVLQRGVDRPAIGVPENLARGLFLHVEKVHLAAQFAVVAFFRFFKEVQVILEFFLAGEGHAVDALQHLAVRVAAPIGPGDGHQLEGVCRDLAGVLQVRAAAQVLPVAVPVHAHGLIAGDGLDQLDLEGFIIVAVVLDRAVTIPDFGAHLVA